MEMETTNQPEGWPRVLYVQSQREFSPHGTQSNVSGMEVHDAISDDLSHNDEVLPFTVIDCVGCPADVGPW